MPKITIEIKGIPKIFLEQLLKPQFDKMKADLEKNPAMRDRVKIIVEE